MSFQTLSSEKIEDRPTIRRNFRISGAKMIIAAREGKANIQAGGGGVYGKLTVG